MLEPNQQQFVEASGERRFANYLIDHFIFVFTIGMLQVVLMVMVLLQQPNPELVIDTPVNLPATPRNPQLLLQGIVLLILFLYYFFSEALFQRTPAKFITGTMVVNAEDGSKPSIGQITVRTLIRFIPFEPLIGLSRQYVDRYDWWHDIWTGTQVVRIEPKFSKLQRLLFGVLAVILYFTFFVAIIFLATPETDQHPGFIQAEATGSNTRIAGDWVKEEPYTYDRAANVLSFYMRDMQGEVRRIQAFIPQPECFEHNAGVMVEGYSSNEKFVAETLLLKLPTNLAC